MDQPSHCPVCKATNPTRYLETYHDPVGNKDYQIFECSGCKVVFSYPYQHPGSHWYDKFSKADSYDGLGWWRFKWFFSLGLKSGSRLFDVGCGTGNFLMLAKAKGYNVSGVDLNPEACKVAHERGLEVYENSLAEFSQKYPEQRFDIVTMFDVIEHFDNPTEMVQLAYQLLKPDGAFVVTTPNGYRPIPFGRDNFDYPPHHLTRWTPPALEEFLTRNGFTVVKSYYTYFPTWEFSRFFVGRTTQKLLKLTKVIFYGSKTDHVTLTQLMNKDASNGSVPSWHSKILKLIGQKNLRTRIVHNFEVILGWVLAPLFLPMKIYYRMTIPGVGSTSCVLSRKVPAAKGTASISR